MDGARCLCPLIFESHSMLRGPSGQEHKGPWHVFALYTNEMSLVSEKELFYFPHEKHINTDYSCPTCPALSCRLHFRPFFDPSSFSQTCFGTTFAAFFIFKVPEVIALRGNLATLPQKTLEDGPVISIAFTWLIEEQVGHFSKASWLLPQSRG